MAGNDPLEDLTLRVEALELQLVSQEQELKRLRQQDLANRMNETKLAELQRMAAIDSWEINEQSGRLNASEPLSRILGEEGLMGYSMDDLRQCIHPDDQENFRHHYEASVNHGRPFELVHRMILKDGQERIVKHFGKTFFAASVFPLKSIGLIQDVTRQKQVEVTLELAKREAEAATQSKTQFLAHMSHEIRTPLNVILGMTQILSETPVSREQHQCLETLRIGGETLLSLVNDILDLSKIEAGQMDLTVTDFHLTKVIEQIANLQSFFAREKGIGFKVRIGQDVPHYVQGDLDRLRQVLSNVVNNAIKFTSTGEVTVTVSKGQNQYILFEVRDTGIGMSKEQTEKVFQPFIQGDSTITRKYGGTGLGLTISRKLVEIMGGTMEVDSHLGKGSCFSISLFLPPVSSGHYLGTDSTFEEASPARKLLNILLVDDADENRMVVRAFLKQVAHRVIEATNGSEAIAIFQEQNIDLVLMDMLMPVLDGYSATRAIRDYEKKRGLQAVPIIALTAHALKEDLARTLEAGCDFYLTKPVRKPQLLETINKFKTG
ncbi:MAG: response regulator [Magnetococcales bacterium]|nr:response regulator [Magnetococcales bacterium]